MENMQGLASAKKMDATTLRSAFNSEKDYVQDRALDPAPPNYNATAATSGNATKTGATALPQGGGKVIDKNTAMQFYQAAGNDPDKARTLALKNGWQIPKAQ
jgi:hypothetical protein